MMVKESSNMLNTILLYSPHTILKVRPFHYALSILSNVY